MHVQMDYLKTLPTSTNVKIEGKISTQDISCILRLIQV